MSDPSQVNLPSHQNLFGNDLVMFTISGFLPGEYALRVIPLLCKATQSHRLSLSLFGQPPLTTRTDYYELEGPIYGIYSTWRELQRVVAKGHSVYALRLDQVLLGFPAQLLFNFKSFPFHRFPNLVMLEIQLEKRASTGETVDLLHAVWDIPLISLTLDWGGPPRGSAIQLGNDDNFIHSVAKEKCRPPACAQTLRSLQTRSIRLLDGLSPHCRQLRHLKTSFVHEIITNNPTLTSLALSLSSLSSSSLSSIVDLTPLTELVNLHLTHCSLFTSNTIHSHLQSLSLHYITDPRCARRFLKACPAVKHISLSGDDWQYIVAPIIASIPINSLADKKCNYRLTLEILTSNKRPTLDAVEKLILQRGFRVNEEFLFKTIDGQDRYKRIMELIPHIKTQWRVLANEELEWLGIQPSFINSFHSLFKIELFSAIPWNQEMLTSLVRSYPLLKELKLTCCEVFLGNLDIESSSLCKMDLAISGFSGFNFRLPKLTHLTINLVLHADTFLTSFLNAGPLTDLPLLRVLSITTGLSSKEVVVPCTVGHASLTQLGLSGHGGTKKYKITLQKVPSLRRLTMEGVTKNLEMQLNIPGDCDISLKPSSSAPQYTRININLSDTNKDSNFIARLSFSKNLWVEKKNEFDKATCTIC